MSGIHEEFLTINEFPPSANDLYFSHPKGGKVMSQKGRSFQRRIIDQINQELGPRLHLFKNDLAYEVRVTVFFPTILNKGWPGKAQQKYKKRDADNILKLLLDTISKAIGVDDANFLMVTVEKLMDPKKPRIEVFIREY